ncbi:hypothetical protein OS493_034434 [Desmophyllum pertusum]|uniref:Uncharacterized protein n=1 Tax=Desmophyllum pertusum TaxID=174260 RepID=A0A9X0D1S2_9CNID|nr:hypothetical protein OS493_034434 [Desmophyllum pertusum]
MVVPDTLYIKEEWGDVTFWANEGGRFNLSHIADGTTMVIMGQNQDNTRNSEAGNCLSYTAPPAGTNKSRLPFRPFSEKGKSTSSSSTSTFGYKVVLAKKNGKSFTELNQTYNCVNEETANVVYITEKGQEKWGEAVLVAGNGLAIQDEEGTRGVRYMHIQETTTGNTTKKRPSHRSDDDFTDGDEEGFNQKGKKSFRLCKDELAELKQETSNLREEMILTNSNV